MTPEINNLVPIYTTKGDIEAFFVFPNIYNLMGEWLGFVTPLREVYSIRGDYVGWISDDPRILRKRTYDYSKPKLTPPKKPVKIMPPATLPLAPLMPELNFDTIDVLQEEPDRLPTGDMGELRPDMD
jgi:hypothetical protein